MEGAATTDVRRRERGGGDGVGEERRAAWRSGGTGIGGRLEEGRV